MMRLKNSLSTLATVASVLGLAACGGSNQQAHANAPSSAQTTSSEQYGSAMGQGTSETAGNPAAQPPPSGATEPYGSQSPAGSGTAPESGATGYGAGSTSSQTPGENPSQGAPGGAYGGTTGATPSQPGATSPYGGASGTTGGGYGTTGPGGTMGAGGTMGTGANGAPGATNTMGGSMDVSTLDDAQVAAVLRAVNQGEIQEAQLAETKAYSPAVKRFARHMLTSHREIESKDQALFSRLQITPSDNAVSAQLKTDAQNDLSTLQGTTGRDFDRDYVDAQVRDHNQALELVDRMLGTVKNPQLKSQLQAVRPKLEEHLREAEHVQQMLQQGTTNRQRGNPSGNQPQPSPEPGGSPQP